MLENLAIKIMVKNHNLAKAISQVGWGQFCTMLKYKAKQEGKIYLEVDRFFPSSKTCHACLNQVGSLLLDVRTWTCVSCNTTHDRDINAAISLRDEGLRLLMVGYEGADKFRSQARETAPPESNSACRSTMVTCGTRDKAYCPDIRPSGRGRKKSTTRQSAG